MQRTAASGMLMVQAGNTAGPVSLATVLNGSLQVQGSQRGSTTGLAGGSVSASTPGNSGTTAGGSGAGSVTTSNTQPVSGSAAASSSLGVSVGGVSLGISGTIGADSR
ncbi:hypothetical protein [Deinococcus sonorensis]|uniref:Uncharacterized protein n=2 Tax=Deinococcus sonorensis TaxID=309891 RepID=A0AAU7U469_9DEIO